MTEGSDFRLVERAFAEAVELTPDQRASFVEAFARDHPALGMQLRQLLDADADEEEPLEARIAGSVGAVTEAAEDHWIGRTVGMWTIERRIGSGGMGAVFLALRRGASYSQSAALKIMAAQLIDADAIARFRTERQILAQLSHPNIARLIDGGSTDEGLPFLVMELVAGVPIDEAVEENGLSLDECLRLFVKVCSAVDFAHRKLIVHRDLKPSNILIDESGEPKLLDFGIAKLLEPGAYDVTAVRTGQGARAMTPEYASPEQIRCEPVSIATDVYALGVLLFRLLTGVSPYHGTTSQREMEDAIVHQEPKRPSAAVSSVKEGATAAASADGSGGAVALSRLRGRLAGDLDNIVLKCLQKEPERRYPTTVALADDLQAYLSGRPISARGDELGYRARKFIRRHAAALAMVTLFVTSAIGLTGFYTYQLAKERDRAQLAARESAEVSDFLAAIFRNANLLLNEGEPLAAIDLVRAAEDDIAALDGQPILQASLKQIIGSVFSVLGEDDRAVRLLEEAMATRQIYPFADPLDLAALHHDLSEAYREARIYPEAEWHMREALDIRKGILPPTHDDVFTSETRLAVNFSDQHRKEEARDLLENVRQRRAQVVPEDDRLALDILGNLAHLYTDLGEYDKARRAHEAVLPLSEKLDGPLHPSTLIRIHNKALFHGAVWEDETAVEVASEAIVRAEQIWTPERRELTTWTANLAYSRVFIGQFNEALKDNLRAIDYARSAEGEQSDAYFLAQRRYAQTLIALARYDEARSHLEALFEKALTIFGEDEITLRQYRITLAELEMKAGRPDVAEKWMADEFLQLEEGTLLAPARRLALARLVEIRSRQERFAEADQALTLLLRDRREALGADSPGMISTLLIAAEHQMRKGDAASALASALEAKGIAQKKLSLEGWWAGRTLLAEASARRGLGEAEEAAFLGGQASAILVRSIEESHPLMLQARQVESGAAGSRRL